MTRLAPLLLALFMLPALIAPMAAGMGVVSIDYGTAFMKAALVKPGMPFDVVLSSDSKRKVPSVVAWKQHERLFGSDAENAAGRFPKDTYAAMKLLLGRELSNEQVKQRQAQLYHTDLVAADNRPEAIGALRTLKTADNQDIVYSIEELVGMQLAHMKQLAEATAGEDVKVTYPGNIGTFGGLDVVLTVPGYFTAAERQAIFDAAQLAGMKPRLVSDGAAAATSYALSRTFPKPEKHMFYDAGAGSTRATIVEFSTQQVKADSVLLIGSTQKEATIVDVLSIGWDRQAGGLALDLIVRDILADKFEKTAAGQSLSTPLRQNDRAMAKLLKEGNRVKQILSANAVASSSVEGLAEDMDWRGKVDREEFEDAVRRSGLGKGFTQPISDALQRADLSIHDLDSVILVGGSTRVPLVQAALREAGVPESKFAQNVNADEAAAMGAAFYGASYNPQFRMKDIRGYDANPYPVLLRDPLNGGKEEVLFGIQSFKNDLVLKSYTGTNVHEDFVMQVGYANDAECLVDGFSQDVALFNISGISSALAHLTANGDISGVKTELNVTFVSKPLGTYAVQNAVLNVKPKVKTGLSAALKSFFGAGGGSDDSEVETTEGNNSTATAAKKLTEAKDKLIKLTVETIPQGGYKPMESRQLKTSKDLLYLLDKDNERRAQRDEARNLLEGYIYRVRDLLEDKSVLSASKKDEREKIKQRVDDISIYLASEGDKAEISVLKLKRADLERHVRPIETRISEASLRDQASESFLRVLGDADAFVQGAQANLTQALNEGISSKYGKAELDTLANTLAKDKKWFETSAALQKKKRIDEDPVFLVEELQKRQRKFSDTIRKLKKRKIAKTRPPKKASPTQEGEAEGSKGPSGTKEPEVPPPPEEAGSAPPTEQTQAKHSPPLHEEL
ncbi:actin-like ATPase domain-containing protein [Tilletiaria anomala UBC 951]|uniref:Actin-like ATPase domain-containing protein n=1 Tax=Tilletiaria anomala (strain ATCC 24038 / CBS 436.72 / UBC 951) TaxID=1037660 RepID=A0A066VZK6_TILAU|nr:actin-like ATPase domain-containing protein [Tilletiaria anomala UBC 951]KDN47167.1 actin-like ATPase domain-containing protein [Tilletiaria anomala UBC 951]